MCIRDRDIPVNEIDYSSQLDKEFLDSAMAAIDENMTNPEFSINDFCRALGMSRTSVYNKIKTLTGQGPNDFIRIVRLNKSKELLLSQKYSVGEVACMVEMCIRDRHLHDRIPMKKDYSVRA